MSKRKHADSTLPRKRRRLREHAHPAPNMICVICLCELAASDVYPHYSQYHSELMINAEDTIKVRKVISAVNLCDNSESSKFGDAGSKIGYGDNAILKVKLEALSERMRRSRKSASDKRDLGTLNLVMRIPKFNLEVAPSSNGKAAVGTGSANMPPAAGRQLDLQHLAQEQALNRHSQKISEPAYSAQKLRHSQQAVNRRGRSLTTRKSAQDKDKRAGVAQPRVGDICTAARPIIVGDGKQSCFDWLIESVRKFESSRHSLSRLLSDDIIPDDLSQCQSLIKVLFEQLWNSRAICDEQMMLIEYHNVIDAGNRMQISFILDSLKKHHSDIYNALYRQLQNDPAWRKWKEMRMNDGRIKTLRQNIELIRLNEEALRRKKKGLADGQMKELQTEAIRNLKEAQSAHIQRYGLSLKGPCNEIVGRRLQGKRPFAVAEDDPRGCGQESVAVMRDSAESARQNAAGKEVAEEDDEKWMETIERFLEEFEGEMNLTEIKEKLADSRYCSEFDVLNDILQVDSARNAHHIKARFCSYFGNLGDWGFKRLISWCQTNKFYNLCQKIRSKKICGRKFIEIVTNINSVKRFFNNLTSPQVIQLYNRINHYFEDSLSIF